MVADFFTKPLQGILFIEYRNSVLGIHADEMASYRKQYDDHVTNLNNLNMEWMPTTVDRNVLRNILSNIVSYLFAFKYYAPKCA